jgi:hypothetical protein
VQSTTDPRPTVEAILSGRIASKASDDPALRRATERAIDEPFFFFYLSYEMVGAALGKLPLPMGNPLAIFAPGQGLDMSLGGDDNHFQIKLNLPLETQNPGR